MVNAATTTLNRAQYAGLDFDTHLDDNLARLQVKFAADFNDFALSGLAIVLLDSTSFGLDTLSFYLDRRATENYLAIARTRKAVSRLTRQLGYKMGAAVSSSVDLSVALRTPVAFDVPIEEGRTFAGPNGIIFTTAKEVVFASGSGPDNTQSIPCFEGQAIEETFVSSGSANQVFELTRVPDGSFVAQGSVEVFVDGSQFAENEFLTFEQTDQFEFAANDDPPTVRFGDGTAGNIPTTGATILVRYVACVGKLGQVGAGTITKIETPLVVNFQTIALNISNPFPAVGGDDAETLEHAKNFAPRVAKSRKVALTRGDYEALAGSFADPLFGRVAVAQAISAKSAGLDIELQNLLESIRDVVDDLEDPNGDLNTSVRAIETASTNIATESTALAADLDDIASANAGILSQAGAIKNSEAVVLENAQKVDTGAGNAATTAGSAAVSVDNLPLIPEITAFTSLEFVAGTNTLDRVGGTWTGDELAEGMWIHATDAVAGSGAVDPANSIPFEITDVTDASLTLNGTLVGQAPIAAANIVATVDLTQNNRLATETKAALVAEMGLAQTQASNVQGLGATISSAAATSNNAAGLIEQDISTVGVNLVDAGTTLKSAIDHLQLPVSGIDAQVADIDAAVATLDAVVVDANDDVDQAISDISAHVTSFLSAECKANLISVPILTRDPAGFYAAPSVGLIQAAQDYLDDRKGATQVVSVTSGKRFLVAAVMTVRVGVSKGSGESVVKTAVEAAIDGVLRDRPFGKSLVVSEVDDVVRAVSGVGFRNIEYQGHLTDPDDTASAVLTDKLDASGNIVIITGEVITKGVVTITTEPAAPLTL
jgi:hypothetical protein